MVDSENGERAPPGRRGGVEPWKLLIVMDTAAEYKRVVVLIPAYRPQRVLLTITQAILSADAFPVVIVDDGSGLEHRPIFDSLAGLPGVNVLRHAVNLGKGAALKTGINHILNSFPGTVGIVTADADGQHDVEDIKRVAQCLAASPTHLVLGVRRFDKRVPLRNRFGNTMTCKMVRLLMGEKISDTQTGLRGIPRLLMAHLLRVPATGYEFELDMLTTAKHRGIAVMEEPIRTIYDHPDGESHFNPLVDSMKIYFVLLRFGLISLITAVIDNLTFFAVFQLTLSIAAAQIVARTAAVLFNYSAARSAVFLSRERHAVILPKYLLLVAVNGLVSYGLINYLATALQLRVIWAKMAAETALFLANFALQRDFVFTKQQSDIRATDWTTYYKNTPPTAKITRKYTTRVLTQALRQFCGAEAPSIAEIGGANSCFLDAVLTAVHPRELHIFDLNEFGLKLLADRLTPTQPVIIHHQDCRTASLPEPLDIVFSVGLIEHFDQKNTREATLAHFRLLRPGGVAIVSFPTPTWLYRVARAVCEALGLWKFPDERPLNREEVLTTVREEGAVLFEKTLWPLVFTQHMIVVRKHS